MILTLSGARGVGKTTIQQLICQHPRFERMISFTSRQPRRGEVDGVDYHFLSREAMRCLLYDGALIESTIYDGNIYGLTAGGFDVVMRRGNVPVAVVEVEGLRQLRAAAKKKFKCPLLDICLMASPEDLARRLTARGGVALEDIEDMVSIGVDEQTVLAGECGYRMWVRDGKARGCAERIISFVLQKSAP